MFVELANGLSDRAKIVPVGEVQPIPVPHDRYISLFPFDQSIKEWVRTHKNDKGNPTVQGHEGIHYLPYLAIDLDNKDNLEQARTGTILLIKRLFEVYELSSDDLFIYFSGNKGFHITIVDKILDCPEADRRMAEKCREFVKVLTDGVPDVDFKIYENHRLFRVDNSLNEKSGLYKYQLSLDELEKFDIEAIKKRGKVPRPDFKRNKNYNNILSNSKLVALWQKISFSENSSKEVVYRDGFFSAPNEGERDNTLFAQAAMLFDKSIFDEKAVLEIIANINSNSNVPLPDRDLRRIVLSAKSKTKNNYKPLELKQEEVVAKSIGEWSREWYENLLPQEHELTLGFSKFDDEMRGRLRGKLGVVLGYGGTKKSLYVKNIAKINADRNLRTIYSMMEMGIGDTINRFVDMKVNGEKENATYALERIEKLQRGEALRLFSEKIAPEYGNNILLSFNSSMTCDKYDRLIEDKMRELGKIDILIVDGLSMMGGDGKSEVERYGENSKRLKEIANKYNILVLLICHVSKGAEKHTRDLSKLIRSSEKILDNCDFYVNFSLIVDETKSTNELTEYMGDKGYSRLVNKRGSGRSVNIIFDFNFIILQMNQTEENTKEYDKKRKQKNILDETY